jgi:hypothetical protein
MAIIGGIPHFQTYPYNRYKHHWEALNPVVSRSSHWEADEATQGFGDEWFGGAGNGFFHHPK